MSNNWIKLQKVKQVESTANQLGFSLAAGRDTWQRDGGNLIYLVPLDDKLPHYSRGAEIFRGTLEEIELWLQGIQYAREYDEMLNLSNDKKRIAREQTELNRQLMQMVKTGKKVDGVYVGNNMTTLDL